MSERLSEVPGVRNSLLRDFVFVLKLTLSSSIPSPNTFNTSVPCFTRTTSCLSRCKLL